MRRKINILETTDWLTVLIYFVLVAFGWMNILAVNLTNDSDNFFSLSNRYTMQLIWIIISLLIAVVAFLIDSRFYSFAAYIFYGLTMFFLLAVLVIGREVHGSKSWIVLGPVSLQPAEFAKAAVILALARYNSGYSVKSNDIKTILISLLFIAVPPLLIMLQPDFGSTLVYSAMILVLYREGLPGWILILIFLSAALFLGTLVIPYHVLTIILICIALIAIFILNRSVAQFILGTLIIAFFSTLLFLLRYFGIINLDKFSTMLFALALSSVIYITFKFAKKLKNILLILAFLYIYLGMMYSVGFVFNNVLKPHQQKRVNVMLGLESDPYGYEYNLRQSKIAIGSGGFSGKGFLNGTQTKYKFVPEQSTDFIFCTVGEEWGFLGSLFLIGLFVGLLIRLINIAERQRSRFSRIYAYGVVAIIFFHFAVNIAMTIGLFPVIGIPLPFISYGGSALMSFTLMLFILLKLDATRKSHLI